MKPYYMKWKFGWLSKVPLAPISLLLMLMACKRTAPRDEPAPLGDQEGVDSSTMQPSYIQKPNATIATDFQPSYPLLNQLPEYKNSKEVQELLQDIGYRESLTLDVTPGEDQDVQNDVSARIEARLAIMDHHGQDQFKRLPDRLSVVFKRDLKDGSWDQCKLAGIASITIRPNPSLPNSEKYTFTLVAFIAEIPKYTDPNHLVVCLKKGKNWYYYNHNSTQAARATKNQTSPKNQLSTAKAMDLASTSGTCFLYQKIT